MEQNCPACGAQPLNIFYSLDRIPVHSVRMLWSRDDARNIPVGKLSLAHCPSCGFISNIAFNPDLQDYSAEYESTQAYSPTFNSFANRLARQLVDRYDLHNKKVIEIGCGQGEFISLLCEIGNNTGIGYDPAFDPSRSLLKNPKSVQIIPDYYSEKYSDIPADFVCCKMTLEHIPQVHQFINTVRRSIGDQPDTTVFFQVPDVARVLKETAFWDIYYEHCSYFSLGSLARLFRSQGFDVRDLWRDYDDQYIMIDARPASHPTSPDLPQEDDLDAIEQLVRDFSEKLPLSLAQWKNTIQETVQKNQKVVLWGSGSKGVAFLTTLDLCDEIQYTVDINPNKHGTYMAGTGQQIVSPEFLRDYRPDLVILMNPIYYQEIHQHLSQMGLTPRIISVGA